MSEANENANLTPTEPPSLIGTPPEVKAPTTPEAWVEYVPDAAKSEEENAAAKAEHDKTKPAEKPAEHVPLAETDIKMPDGMEDLPEAKTEFLGILNNRGLTPAAQAQALIDLQAKVMRDASERVSSLWTEQQTKWQEETKADPEIGGAKLDENLGHISKLIDEYAGKDAATVRQAFDMGAGNNVHVIRFLTKVAKALGEGKPVISGAPTAGGNKTEADLANNLYPTMNH